MVVIIDIASLYLKVSGASTLLASAMGILNIYIYTMTVLPPVVAGLFLMSRAGPLGTYGLLFTPTAIVIAQVLIATRAVDRAIIDTAISMGAGRLHTALTTLNEAKQALIVAVLAGW